MTDPMTDTMRTVRFHEYGDPADVLRLETTPIPDPGPGRVRVVVHACGLAPADWALCRGLFPGELPRGIGCDVSGTVDAIGEDVTDTAVGELVFGTTDWKNCPTAGAADRAIMDRWVRVPEGLDLVQAAALPMAVDTAYAHLHWLGFDPEKTVLVHGAGSTIGFAAVEIALLRGMRVIATAGETYAQRLRDLGAAVTSYGDGMVDRVAAINRGPVDLVLDTAPVGGALPDLVRIAGGDPKRVLTIADFAAAAELGVRDTFHEDMTQRVEPLPEFAQLAADGRFAVPVARTFPLDQWKAALEISQSGHARGKLLLLPGDSGPAAR
ncbi:NADP-dependent oxidoreductase [Glycomyces arizonensis]|uniref:NADP-dependent oxidoreductase n=1 Tax=Glycomyces arizonensis TaxID=256035 RepID=UPI000415D73A|nr:NADP-dependent oxidoreductase [Glycomyces arizonensis]